MSDVSLARRAVACKAWRWMPGMRGWWGDGRESKLGTVVAVRDDDGLPALSMWMGGPFMVMVFAMTPDLDDPATLGCLLALVREAWGDTGIVLDSPWDGERQWVVERGERDGMPTRVAFGPTEAAALVAALEAAP